MKIKIIWTPESIRSFEHIIDYLNNNWSEKEVSSFIKATDLTIKYISKFPLMYRKTDKVDVHEALISPNNLLVYKIVKKEIYILTFWDTRQHPIKKMY